MKISAHVTDTCLPDYYSGDHRPHVVINVHSLMTTGELRKAIMDELRWGYVSGNDDDSSLMRADFILDESIQSSAAIHGKQRQGEKGISTRVNLLKRKR